MNSSVNLNALGKVNTAPKHQSIGNNGTFWMPKKLSVAQQNTLKAPVSSKTKAASTKSNNPSKASNLAVNQKAPEVKSNFEKAIKSETQKVNRQSVDKHRPYPKVRVHRNFSSSQQTLPVKVPVLTVKNVVKNIEPILVTNSIVKENYKKTNFSNLPNRNATERESEKQNDGKRRKNDGAKNAQAYSQVNTDKTETLTTTTGESRPPLGSAVGSNIVNFIGKSVLPRISYINKFSKKVVRFAIDLPRGGKLGVRLEKSPDGMSLSFIAPKNETRNLLESSLVKIQSMVEPNLNKSIRINIFSDYQEMDEYFLKAA